MTVHDLSLKMTAEDKQKMRELYSKKYIAATQHALFLLWMKYTGVREELSCPKCRSRLLQTITKFMRIINNEAENTN